MAKSKDVTCLKLLQLDPYNKRLYLEIDSELEVIPVTLILIGLQRVITENNCYYIVRAEGCTEITSGIIYACLVESCKGRGIHFNFIHGGE
jgi:hypothetical protein